ncbi:MAG: AAA family ATPase [Lentisphaerae bacterium]|jgi:energy-coupling factor transporter ATP-binding protein EcfA2|nr:AAA family ATPase [Lentisphaerota bacterium]
MLKRFIVKNYKCFRDLEFDLTAEAAKDYSFNQNIVKDGIVVKALVYGKNGSGKSSLGTALLDIVTHLTDKHCFSPRHTSNYLNLNTGDKKAIFRYEFVFDGVEVIYEYAKTSVDNLVWERLTIDSHEVLDYSFTDARRRHISPELAGKLNMPLPDNRLSILKYIYRNTPTTALPRPFLKMMRFCEGMLWFRSLSDGNSYCGLTNGNLSLVNMLHASGELKEFQDFLAKNELEYDLHFEDIGGEPELWAYFDKGQRKARFIDIASAGTKALMLFFNWMTFGKKKLSFMFIDEFDAYYHYEVAASILTRLNEQHKGLQAVLTTHNTYLMQNKLTRPDCCYILTNEKATSLKNATKRELREAHNLENLYTNGAFET